MKLLRMLLCCLGLVMLAGNAQANLLVNGNFEAGGSRPFNGGYIVLYPEDTIPGWSIIRQAELQIGGTGGGSNTSIVVEFAGYSLIGAGALTQSVTLQKGATYEVSFDYYNRFYGSPDLAGRALGGVSASLGGNTIFQTSPFDMQQSDYRKLATSFVFTGASGSTIFSIGGFTNLESVGGLVDNVSLTQTKSAATPVPAAALLLGSGFAGLLGLRRRFKR